RVRWAVEQWDRFLRKDLRVALEQKLCARSQTFWLEVRIKSPGFQASMNLSHPRQAGSAFLTA
ncbi:MAG: hypothetical protein AB2556_20155, partial [Candidatus Thiodiazotropha sp.]